MSDRVCQFFLRGRCHRQNCEFKHVSPDKTTFNSSPSSSSSPASVCRFFQSNGTCRYGDSCRFRHAPRAEFEKPPAIPKPPPVKGNDSDDESILRRAVDSDEDSVASGFTEICFKKNDVETTEPKPVAKKSSPATEEIEETSVETPNEELNHKTLEETVQPPVKDSIDADGADNGTHPIKDSIETDSNSNSEKAKGVSSPATQKPSEAKKSVRMSSVSKSPKTSPAKSNGKKTVADLSKEWDDDDDDEHSEGENEKKDEKAEESKNNVPQDDDTIESIENIENFIQDDAKSLSSVPVDKEGGEDKGKDAGKSKDEWVALIFGEDGVAREQKKSVYDLNPEGADFAAEDESTTSYGTKREDGATRLRPRRSIKKGVTKIGNNMYFYTGPKTENEDDNSQEEGEEEEVEEGEEDGQQIGEQDGTPEWDDMTEEYQENTVTEVKKAPRPRKRNTATPGGPKKRSNTHSRDYVYAGKSTAAKTRRCGECENCNKEDCNKCDACRDKPRNGGKGSKKQACVHRVCLWKNPSRVATVVKRRASKEDTTEVTKTVYEESVAENQDEKADESSKSKAARGRRGRMSLPVIAPGMKSTPDDRDLPKFDPDKFKPGYVPPVVKKGDAEYHVVVTGVPDTGLCGKYWNDVDNGSRRRSRAANKSFNEQEIAAEQSAPPKTKSQRRSSIASTTKSPKTTKKQQESSSPSATSSSNKRKSKSATPQGEEKEQENEEAMTPPPAKKTRASETVQRKTSTELSTERKEEEQSADQKPDDPNSNAQQNEFDKVAAASTTEPLARSRRSVVNKTFDGTSTSAATGLTGEPSPMTNNRSVSCVADTSTQREVVVECFAPYDDHRWVNIGKERDNMAPDAVQYARALRPPYHLLSFLRIKGHSTKGMSCTDKNTMVFVVLEGEITVVLHTTQFNAKKGDSFYIPPKNYYNLINQKAREAELSLIQFQYDGPLPTVAAGSQSGNNRGIMRATTTN